MSVEVECHAGACADETPRAVWIDGDRKGIARVVDRATVLAPGVGVRRRFRVRLDDGRDLTLEHDPLNDRWHLSG